MHAYAAFLCNFCLISKICTVLSRFLVFSIIYGRKKQSFSITKYELAVTVIMCITPSILHQSNSSASYSLYSKFFNSTVNFSNQSLAKFFCEEGLELNYNADIKSIKFLFSTITNDIYLPSIKKKNVYFDICFLFLECCYLHYKITD